MHVHIPWHCLHTIIKIMSDTVVFVVGRVRKIYAHRHYGFIDGGGPESDVFFHRSVVRGAALEELTPGQPVKFEPENREGRLRARSVQRITEAEYELEAN